MKKVKITKDYHPRYIGQIGTVIDGDDTKPVWTVRMEGGATLHPYAPHYGRAAQCELVSNEPKSLPIFN